MSRRIQIFTCSSVIWNIHRLWETSRPDSEIERTLKMSPTKSLVHDLSLWHHGWSIKSLSDTFSVLQIFGTSSDSLFFNWWLRACQLFGRAPCRIMEGCESQALLVKQILILLLNELKVVALAVLIVSACINIFCLEFITFWNSIMGCSLPWVCVFNCCSPAGGKEAGNGRW